MNKVEVKFHDREAANGEVDREWTIEDGDMAIAVYEYVTRLTERVPLCNTRLSGPVTSPHGDWFTLRPCRDSDYWEGVL